MRTGPALLFVLLSLLAGLLTVGVTPPLRGPDENAHFLRAYGIATGDLVPQESDPEGRKGIVLPGRIAGEFGFFDYARLQSGTGFSYRSVIETFRDRDFRDSLAAGAAAFTPYGGSEGYSPVAYVPYAAAAALARLADLDFVPMVYLMRIAGLVAATAIIAGAIALTPVLPWCFFAVAMLPSAVFGRATINADGAVLGTTFVVIALCLRAALGARTRPAARAVWIALCALTKPSQIVFVMLDAMTRPFGSLRRDWMAAAAVAIPGIALSGLWVAVAGTDMGGWRLYQGTALPAEQFEAGWKLRFMLDHPLHFPALLLASFDQSEKLWSELVGVLGWLDAPLRGFAYPALGILLALACIDRVDAPGTVRRRIALVSAATLLAYWLLVHALFFVTSTPVFLDHITGVQGRYFLMAVPLAALPVAALGRWAPAVALRAGAAILLSLGSTLAIVDAMLLSDWR